MESICVSGRILPPSFPTRFIALILHKFNIFEAFVYFRMYLKLWTVLSASVYISNAKLGKIWKTKILLIVWTSWGHFEICRRYFIYIWRICNDFSEFIKSETILIFLLYSAMFFILIFIFFSSVKPIKRWNMMTTF